MYEIHTSGRFLIEITKTIKIIYNIIKHTMITTLQMSRTNLASVGLFLTLAVTLLVPVQKADAALVNQLQVGSRGNEVTQLQQFLATNPLIYPQALVTGVFGPLTHAAVVQFQVAYDIPQVGRVGPMTRSKINEIMSSGFGLDTKAPSISNLSLQAGRTGATINWSTDESALGQVFYDIYQLRPTESLGQAGQPYVSGTLASNTSGVRSTQSVSVSGLQANTAYSYLVRSIDNSGNITMTLPNTFKTDY